MTNGGGAGGPQPRFYDPWGWFSGLGQEIQDWWRNWNLPQQPTWGPSVQPVAPTQFQRTPSARTALPGPAGGSYRTAPPMPTPIEPIPGQYTPSLGFGMLPPPDYRATPGNIPVAGLTPVEAALATVGQLAAAEPEPEPAPEVQFPGYWEAIGQQPGNYPVPQGAVQGMWGPRRPWEEWSWRTRGIPLQGYEIMRVEGGRPPWGVERRGGRRRGGGGGAPVAPEPAPSDWRPGAWSSTF